MKISIFVVTKISAEHYCRNQIWREEGLKKGAGPKILQKGPALFSYATVSTFGAGADEAYLLL